LRDVGAWWGAASAPTAENPRRQEEREVDVVAVGAGGRVAVVGEAKWSRAPIGLRALHRLRETARHVPGYDDQTRLMLFGRAFEPHLVTVAEAGGVQLVGPDDLYDP
jgi:hypothetical protein